jgi:hypothetical protein
MDEHNTLNKWTTLSCKAIPTELEQLLFELSSSQRNPIFFLFFFSERESEANTTSYQMNQSTLGLLSLLSWDDSPGYLDF